MKKGKKNLMINVDTLPNGYSLKFDGMKQPQGFMYFTKEKLLEGFMLHIGLNMLNDLKTQDMSDFLLAVKNWNENQKCVDEILRQNHEMKILRGKRASLALQLIKERRKYIDMAEDLEMLATSLKKYPDVEMRKRVNKIINGKKIPPELKLSDLDIKSDDIIDDNKPNNDE